MKKNILTPKPPGTFFSNPRCANNTNSMDKALAPSSEDK
jgi:hypothetical protein